MLLVPIALLELLVFRNCFEELISPMNWQFEVVIEFRESFYENNHCMSFACDTFFNMQKTKHNGGLSKCWDCMKELLATFLYSFHLWDIVKQSVISIDYKL
jgi:hypothetical protein